MGEHGIYELHSRPIVQHHHMIKDYRDRIYPSAHLFSFVMAHVFGPTKNLDTYMKDIQACSLIKQ